MFLSVKDLTGMTSLLKKAGGPLRRSGNQKGRKGERKGGQERKESMEFLGNLWCWPVRSVCTTGLLERLVSCLLREKYKYKT